MGHIFISYSHKDTTYAHGLAAHLRNMGFDIWMDERLDYGSQWPHEIQNHLDSCDAFILIMTPRSFVSDWVQSELQRAKRKAKPVFPLLLDGGEPWLSVESIQYYDVRDGRMPDEEFFEDLSRRTHSAQTIQTLAQRSTTKAQAASNTRLGRNPARLLPAVGILGVCLAVLAVSVLLFQKASDSLSSFVPAEPDVFPSEIGSLQGTTPSTTLLATSSAKAEPVQLPDGSEVVMITPGGSTFQYTILSAQREPLAPDRFLLRLRIRVWTDGGLNFGTNSFRLAAGDRRLAPVNYLNEVVERDQTMDGDIEFEIDPSLKGAVLVITASGSGEPWATKELRLVFP